MTDVTGDKRVVNVTVDNSVNNNNNVGTVVEQRTGTGGSIVGNQTAKQPSPSTAALIQAYLTLNGLSRSSGNNCTTNTTVVSHSSLATKTRDAASVVSSPSVQNEVKHDLYVKVINPDKKKEFNTYVLRGVSKEKISTPQKLRKELKNQFGDKLISSKLDFPVGYLKSGAKVSIRVSADLDDVWKSVTKGDQLTLWCHGISSNESSSGSDSDTEINTTHQSKRRKVASFEQKNKRVDKTVALLREKHSGRFTNIQYRLWAEMLDVGTHRSMDDPPGIPAFGNRVKQVSPVQNLLKEVAKALVPKSQEPEQVNAPNSSSVGISPGKVANLRSNYLQQMRDLHTLFECGALTEDEFKEQKEPILNQLKKLSAI